MTARRGRPEAVLFDLDGTLVDSALGIAAALTAVRNRHGGGAISPDGVRPWISLGAKELVRRALEDVVPACSPADLTEFRAELARTPADRACIYPGVEALLEALFEEGVAAAVVTNKPEDLSRQLLRELGLADQFAAVVGGDTTARPKPDPAPVRAALEAMGAAPAQAVFVGDSVVDAAAAQSTGLPFYLYEGGYGPAECPPAMVTGGAFAHFDYLRALLFAKPAAP